MVNLQALLNRFEQNLPQPQRVNRQSTEALLRVENQAVLVLLSELARGAYDLIDQRSKFHGLNIEFELPGLNL